MTLVTHIPRQVEYHRHCEQQEALIKAERLAALKKQQEEERKAAAELPPESVARYKPNTTKAA